MYSGRWAVLESWVSKALVWAQKVRIDSSWAGRERCLDSTTSSMMNFDEVAVAVVRVLKSLKKRSRGVFLSWDV